MTRIPCNLSITFSFVSIDKSIKNVTHNYSLSLSDFSNPNISILTLELSTDSDILRYTSYFGKINWWGEIRIYKIGHTFEMKKCHNVLRKHTMEFEVNFFVKAVSTSHLDCLVNLMLISSLLAGQWCTFIDNLHSILSIPLIPVN